MAVGLARRFAIVSLAVSLLAVGAKSQQRVEQIEFLRDLFLKGAYSEPPFGPARWLNGGEAYTTLEESQGREQPDIVRYEAATGKREVLISSQELVPTGANQPLALPCAPRGGENEQHCGFGRGDRQHAGGIAYGNAAGGCGLDCDMVEADAECGDYPHSLG